MYHSFLIHSSADGHIGCFHVLGCFERTACILSIVKQITSPGWMHETSTQDWCAGKTRGIGWRGRGEGGSGWGIHVTQWLIHVSVWQNPLKCCEVISLQLIKINEKNKNKKIKSTEWTWVKWFKKENNQDPPPLYMYGSIEKALNLQWETWAFSDLSLYFHDIGQVTKFHQI